MKDIEINSAIREITEIQRDDFDRDLNAMHEVEKTLSEAQGGDYDLNLWIIIKRDGTRPASWHASSHQRSEAFLRTMGKWKE